MSCRFTTVLIFALVSSRSSAQAPPPARADEPDLTSSGTRDLAMPVADEARRKWRLHVPKREPVKPLPLVLVFHGVGSSGLQMEALTGFDALADREGFVVAYPEGVGRMWRFGALDGGKKDSAFVAAMIDALVKAGTVDPRRVYLTGLSNGAYLCNALACELGDKIAAIAPVAGTIVEAQLDHLAPPHPMPVVYFHGTADSIVGYDGVEAFSKSKSCLSAEEYVAWWAAKNGCESKPTIEKLPDRIPDDGTTVEKRTFAGTAPVVLFRIEGGGHTWPGMPPIAVKHLGKTSREIDASELIWEFCSKQVLGKGAEKAGVKQDGAGVRPRRRI